MSDPKTDIPTQEKRHFGALGGMAIGIGIVAALIIGFLAFSSQDEREVTEQLEAPDVTVTTD